MTDQELFKELVKRKVLDPTLSEKVLKDAELLGRGAEEFLYERRLADEEAVASVKAELLGAPYKKIDPELIPQDLLQIIPQDTSRNYRVIPIERRPDLLVVGMLRPDDPRAQEALRFIAKRERVSLGVFIVTPSVLSAVWRRYAPFKSEIESAVKEIGIRPGEEERLISLEEGAQSAEEAPIIKIVASTLRRAVEINASDVHIEPQRLRLRVRFRVDGKLQEVASLPISLSQPIVSRVKVLARLRLDETRIPQDGRFRTVVSGRDIDYRVATFPTPSGEKVAIRVLDPNTGLKGLKEIGLNDYHYKVLEKAINSPYGMILITGPTGSGKSTTLYAIMQKINSDKVNVLSLEDPVEYFMEGINQSQVKPEIGYDFASGLRQILRQDPDIIMVGEIRDAETASLAVNAALTGHTMLSTLHTNNSIGVVPRLIDLGVQPFLLSSALNLMLAQRLLTHLCPDCKKEEKIPYSAKKIVDKAMEDLPVDLKKTVKPVTVSYLANPGTACKTCGGKGTLGRIAIFEIFVMTRELGEIINSSFTEGKLQDEARRQGMISLRLDGIIKALDGIVPLQEVLQETEQN